jgi:hypothetical protein
MRALHFTPGRANGLIGHLVLGLAVWTGDDHEARQVHGTNSGRSLACRELRLLKPREHPLETYLCRFLAGNTAPVPHLAVVTVMMPHRLIRLGMQTK